MRIDDLPLFNWTPPRKVIPFPTRRRIGKVRRVTEILERKRGRDADTYWRRTVLAMSDQMTAAGIAEPEIEAELRDFFDAVQREIERRAYQGQRPGGAA